MGKGKKTSETYRSLAGRSRRPVAALAVAAAVMLGALAPVWAGEPSSGGWLDATRGLAAAVEEEPVPEKAPVPEGAGEEAVTKCLPIGLAVDYTLVSDYIWRGVNFSEYHGEGREDLNHQLGVGASYDTGGFGTIAAGFWFEWYAGQTEMDSASDDSLQEVDYTLSWAYDIEAIATSVEIGWIWYQFPQTEGENACTQEWYIALGFDDSCLFGTENPVLNPYVAYYMDVDDNAGGQWLEMGISHDFAFADMGAAQTPVLKDLTVTPSLVLGVDHTYFHDSTQLANLTYGLAATYDLSGALNIPEKYGAIGLTGFLNFSQALGLGHDIDDYDDVLYGGFTLGWEW